MQIVAESGERVNLTATGTIAGDGSLIGVFVSQASAVPTLKVADAAGTIANTFTPVAGTFYRLPTRFAGNLTVTISGTVDATVFHAS